MGELKTNIFPITNLAQLSSHYQLYFIKGLEPTHPEYYQNRQILQKQLSYQLQNPVLVVERDGLPYLVVRSDMQYKLPPRFVIVTGKAVSFEQRHAPQQVDYTKRSELNDAICLRFLQFAIQGVIRQQYRDLWQTQSGMPFYTKTPIPAGHKRERFDGFTIRPMVSHDGGIGLCVDVTSKTLSRYPLPTFLARDQFHRWKGKNSIYKYGEDWFEIQINSLGETYSEHLLVLEDNKVVSLQEYITQNADEPLPPEIAQLSPDTSVIVYFNNRGEERAAPTPLCYPIYGTDDEQTGMQHKGTILQAHDRYPKIGDVVKDYLSNLHMGDTPILVADEALPKPPEQRSFQVPDLRFGHETTLSVRGTNGALKTALSELGRTRVDLLRDASKGFYISRPLDQQYLILPMSVYRSWGKTFIRDVTAEMKQQYPAEPYAPQVIPYDDSGKSTFVQQGRKLRKFIRGRKWKPGFAVIMIHHSDDKQVRDEDQLAALVLRELRKQGVHGAVIHNVTGTQCYEYTPSSPEPSYVWSNDRNKRGQLAGYIRNVVLNKILLTNSIWPFVLETPLHADVTIGLDVKGRTASLVVVGKRGSRIRRSLPYESKQKEKLLDGQARKYFLEVLQDEIRALEPGETIRHIVVHRDGIAFESEIQGIRAAIETLKQEGDLPSDATLTILEIAKSAMVPVRLFDVTKREGKTPWVTNPEVGDWYMNTDTDAYLCSTGRAFEKRGKQRGTTQPLHVHYVEGELSFLECLEDVYALTVLAWTRPEDCSRVPITIRLNDRFLREEATDYDNETLEFSYDPQEVISP
jgi:hypothetical protein